MIHKVSEMCDMVEVMYQESLKLRKMKYDTPALYQNKTLIDEQIKQIQYLALLVANDKEPYVKREN